MQPILIFLTDGAGNVRLVPGRLDTEETPDMANLFATEEIHSVVVNMEQKIFDSGLAQKLAEDMGAVCYTVDDLRGDTLYQTVQKEIQTPSVPSYRDQGSRNFV